MDASLMEVIGIGLKSWGLLALGAYVSGEIGCVLAGGLLLSLVSPYVIGLGGCVGCIFNGSFRNRT